MTTPINKLTDADIEGIKRIGNVRANQIIDELLDLRQQVKDWRECANWFSQNFEGSTQKLDLYQNLLKKYGDK
jgi:hypothetical protein